MTLYELYKRRIEQAEIEATYGGRPWTWIRALWASYWKNRLERLTVGEAGEKLAATPRRRMYG